MKVVFFGSPQFAVPFLNALVVDERFQVVGVVTQPDRPIGRSKTPQPSAVGRVAAAYGIPTEKPERAKDPALLDRLKTFEADVFVVVAYGHILPQTLLDLPPLGTINVHPSLLPKYRGATPMQGAIAAGDTETGITIMRMDAKMDHGPILAQLAFPLSHTVDYPELETTVTYKGPPLLLESLLAYHENRLRLTPQKDEEATYVTLLSRDSGRVDWQHQTAQDIERLIRAYRPWPGVWTTFEGSRLKILRASTHKGSFLTSAGTVSLANGSLLVETKKGALELHELQQEGKTPTSAKEFLRGHEDLVGKQLGT